MSLEVQLLTLSLSPRNGTSGCPLNQKIIGVVTDITIRKTGRTFNS